MLAAKLCCPGGGFGTGAGYILHTGPNFYLSDYFFAQPENIVCSGRNGESVKIIDFGTALQLTPGQQAFLFSFFKIKTCFYFSDVDPDLLWSAL